MAVNDRKVPSGFLRRLRRRVPPSSTDLPMHADMRANPFDMYPNAVPEIPLELHGMYTAVHCCNESAVRSADPSTIHGLDYGSRIFSVRIRNRCSVTDTDQRRNLVHRIFRKSFKKKVREKIRILLRKDYAFYFRFFVHIILQVFPGLFPYFFPKLFHGTVRYKSQSRPRKNVPSGFPDVPGSFPTVPTDLFPDQ